MGARDGADQPRWRVAKCVRGARNAVGRLEQGGVQAHLALWMAASARQASGGCPVHTSLAQSIGFMLSNDAEVAPNDLYSIFMDVLLPVESLYSASTDIHHVSSPSPTASR